MPDPFSQLRNMPKEPQIGENATPENATPENATPEGTQKMQQEARKSLYEGNIDKDNQNSIDNLDGDSLYFPILKALYEAGHIDSEAFLKTAESLEEIDNEQGLDVLMKVVNGLSDSQVRESIIKTFDKKEKTTEENFEKTEFFKDSSSLNIDLDKGVGGLELMLADNYISINNSDGTDDKSRDLSVSIDTTMNLIIKNNSIDFRKQNGPLIDEIRTETNLNSKYKLLKELYKNDLKHDAIHGGDKAKKEINNKKNSIIKKAETLNQKIIDAKKIDIEDEKKKELERLNIEKQKLVEEGIDIDFFESEVETLSGGDLDKNNEENDNLKN